MKHWLRANSSLLEAILSDLNTPIALSVLIELRNQEWDNLASRWVDPQHYPEGLFSALKFQKDTQAVDLLRKAPLPTRIDRKQCALSAWEDAETRCFVMNEYLDKLRGPWALAQSDICFRDYLMAVRKRVRRWLGPIPQILEGGFGPGTCVEYVGGNPTVVDKIWLTPTTTPDAADLFRWHYDQTLWGRSRWAGRLGAPGLSRGNRLTTVPKDGKVDRPISIEPLGNLWLQLGVGRHLKRRIKEIGLPAYKPDSQEIFPGYFLSGPDAQTVHRDLLLRCKDEFSTIDLSSASDTISRELVRWLLPDDWFSLLNAIRSKMTLVPSGGKKVWRHIEKFSSMGNGFTFELESLLFTALLSVAFELTPGSDLYVFGDDIILPKVHFSAACNLLDACGFVVNRRKSFHDGPFYESCGGNVHSGIDVTPVRIKTPIECPAALYAFHNALHRRGFSRRSLRKVRNLIPKRLQFAGPYQLGDSVLHGLPWTEKISHSIHWVSTLQLRPEVEIPLDRWSDELAVVALLLGASSSVVRRGTRTVPVRGRASVS